MLLVVPSSGFEEIEIQRLVHAKMKKDPGGVPLEHVASRSAFWMPYYKIRFEYSRSEKDLIKKFGEKAQSETALNAMFCNCVGSESDLSMLFRPNYLKYKMITYPPQSDEIIGPTSNVDFDVVLPRFLKRLNEVKDELHELRSTLNKNYARIRRYSMILPVRGELKRAERLSEKIGKLNALKNIFSMCLNLGEDAESIQVLSNSIFYYPTLVATLKQKEHEEAGRFLIIDLVKRGLISKTLNLEDVLTKLCNKNGACREVLAKSVTSLH